MTHAHKTRCPRPDTQATACTILPGRGRHTGGWTMTREAAKLTITEAKLSPRMPAKMDENGCYYIPNGTPLRQFRVASGANAYIVTQTANDETGHDDILRTWACTCPAGQHSRLCKHVNAVIGWLDEHEDDEP